MIRKRGQLSLEFTILVMAMVFGSIMCANSFLKDDCTASEISNTKQVAFAPILPTSESKIMPTPVNTTTDTNNVIVDESNIVDTVSFNYLNINPGSGIGFGIYEFEAEYYINKYGINKDRNSIYVSTTPINYITVDNPYIGNATKIYVKAKGNSQLLSGISIPTKYNLYIIETKNIGIPFAYTLYKQNSDSGYGDVYLKIDDSVLENIDIRVSASGKYGETIILN